MKTAILALILLMALSCGNIIPEVSVSTTTFTQDLRVTYGSPADPSSITSIDFVSEDFLSTTNPSVQGKAMGEVSEAEGDNPLYVLVFAEEEER